jgi:hypothetical protein
MLEITMNLIVNKVSWQALGHIWRTPFKASHLPPRSEERQMSDDKTGVLIKSSLIMKEL